MSVPSGRAGGRDQPGEGCLVRRPHGAEGSRVTNGGVVGRRPLGLRQQLGEQGAEFLGAVGVEDLLDVVLDALYRVADRGDAGAAEVGEFQGVAAAVVRVLAADHEPGLDEFLDQRGGGGFGEVQVLGELLLRAGTEPVQGGQQTEVAGAQAELSSRWSPSRRSR